MKNLSPLLIVCAIILLSCAGTSQTVEEEIDQAEIQEIKLQEKLQEQLREAETRIESGTPKDLKSGIEILISSEMRSLPGAEELSALAGVIFTFLYPELDQNSSLKELPAYSGPYKEILAGAGQGKAQEIKKDDPERVSFFDLVLPSFYLLKQPGDAAQQDLETLSASLEMAGTQNRDSILPPFFQGVVAELGDQLEQARAFYKESISRDDSFYPGNWRLGLVDLKIGLPAEAVICLEKVLRVIPQNSSAGKRLAEAYQLAGESDRASALIARELIKNPEDADYLMLRARILKESGNWLQALKPLNLILLKHPEVKKVHLLKAQILYENAKKSDDALILLRESEKQFPDCPEIQEMIGRILMETGKNAEGLKKLSRALELEPGRITSIRLLLKDAVRMKRWQQAEIYLAKIPGNEKIEEDLVTAYQIYSNLGDKKEALSYAEKLYHLGSRQEFIPIYAKALLSNQNSTGALSIIEKGLAGVTDPQIRSDLFLLKAVEMENKDRQAAHKYIQRALMEYPDNLEALIIISELYVGTQEYQKARLFLKRAVQIDPNNLGLKILLKQVENQAQNETKR